MILVEEPKQIYTIEDDEDESLEIVQESFFFKPKRI